MSCRGVAIRIDESTDCGVIIAGLEVIEAAFGIIVVATVAERVFLGQGAGGCEELAVGVIGIGSDGVSGRIHHAHDIALQVGHIIIGGAIDLHGVGFSGIVVEEIMGLGGPVGRYLLLQQLPTGIDIAVSGSVFGLQNLFAGLANGFVAFLWRRFFIRYTDS